MKIAEYLGDGLYTELDVDESDYWTLPASEFYSKVEASCMELRPDVYDRVVRELASVPDIPVPGPAERFGTEKKAREYCRELARGDLGLCLSIMDDVFWDDRKYRVNAAGAYREMREVYLSRCREEGRRSFLESLPSDRKRVLAPGITAGNMVAYAMWMGPRYCFQYCLKTGKLRRSGTGYVRP